MVDNYFYFAIVLLLLQVLLTRPRRSPRHRMPIGSETRTCSETDCGRPHYARGLCNNCYRKVQRRGGFDKHSRELNTITGILDEVINGSGWCAVVHLLLSPVLGGGWSCSEAIVLVRLGGGCECSYRPMGALMHLLGNSHPFLVPTVELPGASALSPAVVVCLPGFRGVVHVLRVVPVFELIRRCISRDRSLDLAQDLRPQLFRAPLNGRR